MTGIEFREKYSDYRPLAEEISKHITVSTVRTYHDGNFSDTERETTEEEKYVIYNLAYAAMLAYGWCDTNNLGSILDTVEFALHQFLPYANSYDTIYIPIRNYTETW